MRLLRAVRAHAGPASLLVATTVLSVAAVVVATAAAGDEARRTVLVPIAALALLVAAGPATDLARRRRPELTLVRLRGATGPRLLARVVGESIVVALVAGVLGLAVGAAAVRLLHTSWDLPVLIDTEELGPALLLVAGLVAVAAAAAGVVAREPLQIAIRRRTWTGPGATATFVGLVCAIATVLAAVVAVYSASSDDPGSLVLAGSFLIGAAAGQLAVWSTRVLSTIAARAAGSRSTTLLLGVRRALGAGHGARLRAVVAAGVVVAAGAGAVTATSSWAEESARLRQGGPLVLDLPDASAQAALNLTRRLDPEGQWLMAAGVNDTRDEARYRTAWLDLERYERVAADFLSPTTADVGAAVDELRSAPAARTVTGDAVELEATGPAAASVSVTYVDDAGVVGSVDVPLSTGQAELENCLEACIVLSLSSTEVVEVAGLSVGDTDLLDQVWVSETGETAGPGALVLQPGVVLRPAEATAPVPVLVAGDPDYGDGPVEVDDLGGVSRPVELLGERPALPLVEGAGLLGDLSVGLAGAPGTVPAVRSVVLARADTPDEVLAGLRDAGAESPRALDPARGGLGAEQRAEDRVRRAGLVAAIGLGLLALATGRRSRRRALAHDDASLRLVGVRTGALRRARLVEATVLALLVFGATLAGGWLAVSTFVEVSGLVPTGPSRLPLDASSPPVPLLVGTALAAALLTGLSVLPGSRRTTPAHLLTGDEAVQ